MSHHPLSTDCIVSRAAADTDTTILICDGKAYALVEQADDAEVCGYGKPIPAGYYVYCPYAGYSWYVEAGELRSMHGTPDDLEPLELNDGDQDTPAWADPIGALLALSAYERGRDLSEHQLAALIDAGRVDPADLCVVETMPEHLRASHTAAGHRGVYPHNGADRVTMRADDAESCCDGDWTCTIDGADPRRYPLRDAI